jgi:protein FAM50
VKKGVLSFDDEDQEEQGALASSAPTPQAATPDPSATPTDSEAVSDGSSAPFKKRGLRPNATVAHQPKAMTKSALLKEAQLKEALRREYIQIQEAVKATEFVLPFVFYDGKNSPGGMCRMKKGDHIWLFLERARKVGADKADKGRRDWARISVDDLMLVKGDLIIPQVSKRTTNFVEGSRRINFHCSIMTFIISSSIIVLGI